MTSTGLTSAAGTRNTSYYTRIFNDFENAGGAWRPSWNWAALLCSTGWFFYRRMFVCGAVNLVLLLLVALPFTLHRTPGETEVAQGVLLAYVLFACAAVPLLANWVYYRHLRQRLGHDRDTAPTLWSFGAAAAASAAAVAAALYALVIGSATDYAVRVHVVDAMLAVAPYQTAVERFVKDQEKVPATQTEAFGALPGGMRERAHPGIKLAQILPGGVVRLSFGGYRHINGRSVEFVPSESEKGLAWRCYNIDMPERELPVQCRTKRPAERKPLEIRKKAPSAAAAEQPAAAGPAAEPAAAPAK